jgi:hypothetical protein
MINVLKLWFSSIATTFANFGALLVFATIYALLLVASYLFISLREATIWQVLVTYVLMILIPLGFFVLQASIIDRVVLEKLQWRVILLDALKFLAVFVPVLLLAWLVYYLLNKLSLRYPAPVVEIPAAAVSKAAPPAKPPLHWPSLMITTLRWVLLGVAFPLATIHLWIAVAGGALFSNGAKVFFKRLGSSLVRAFSSDSVLIYGLGLVIFFVLPYVILVPTFTINGNKREFAVFVLRLLLSYLFSLVGWVLTLTALTRNVSRPPVEVSAPVMVQPTESTA